jgi:hypothetical protein
VGFKRLVTPPGEEYKETDAERPVEVKMQGRDPLHPHEEAPGYSQRAITAGRPNPQDTLFLEVGIPVKTRTSR